MHMHTQWSWLIFYYWPVNRTFTLIINHRKVMTIEFLFSFTFLFWHCHLSRSLVIESVTIEMGWNIKIFSHNGNYGNYFIRMIHRNLRALIRPPKLITISVHHKIHLSCTNLDRLNCITMLSHLILRWWDERTQKKRISVNSNGNVDGFIRMIQRFFFGKSFSFLEWMANNMSTNGHDRFLKLLWCSNTLQRRISGFVQFFEFF